ncbi:MAG: ribonuclease P protein component [Christensenellales bacterium]
MQKKYRLSGRRVFNYLYRKGTSVACGQLVLIYAPSRYPLKVGVVVSKKVGKAVVRNKIRRRIKEAFRLMIPHVADNYNYVVVARPQIATLSYAQIRNSLIGVLKKAKLYN